MDVFWWLKQSTAILTGIALGYMGVTGWLGFVTFAALQYLVANLWAQHAQLVGVCIEPFDVFTESAFVAAGTFVVRTHGCIRTCTSGSPSIVRHKSDRNQRY